MTTAEFVVSLLLGIGLGWFVAFLLEQIARGGLGQ